MSPLYTAVSVFVCHVAAHTYRQAGEPFKVYVVTPLHPESAPTSGSVQVGASKQGGKQHSTRGQAAQYCSMRVAPLVHKPHCVGRLLQQTLEARHPTDYALCCVLYDLCPVSPPILETLYAHTVLTHVVPMLMSPPYTPPHPQGILHFQHLTRKMMYRLVADALEAEGITTAQPKDYLHFFCLGKREPMTPVSETPCGSSSHTHLSVCGAGSRGTHLCGGGAWGAVGLCGVSFCGSLLQSYRAGTGEGTVWLSTHTQHGPTPQAGRWWP